MRTIVECVHCGKDVITDTPHKAAVCFVCRERKRIEAEDNKQLEGHLAALRRMHDALTRIVNYPVHSEPVGAAYAMQDIAASGLTPPEQKDRHSRRTEDYDPVEDIDNLKPNC